MDLAFNGFEDRGMTFHAQNMLSLVHSCSIAKGLDEREHLIFVNRDLGSMSRSDIAEQLGVTTERVRHIEIRLKVKMRNRLFAGEDRVACACQSN